jgi:hypothetical protein
VVSFIIFYFFFLHPSKPSFEPPIGPPIAVKPEAKEVTVSPPQIEKIPSPPKEQPFSIQLKADEETWVRIQIDGQPEYEMTIKPGETTSHQGLKSIHLLVGNAGGLNLIFNGKSLEKFGKSGEVVDLTVTPEGVEAKLYGRPKPKPEPKLEPELEPRLEPKPEPKQE